MGNTRDTGYLRNLVAYDASNNITLPANLTVTGVITGYATTSYVTTQINNLINGAPGLLDTLDELAAALGDDANFAATLTTSLSGKQASLSGTGFVKVSGTTVSYDNSTYLTTSSASSTYVPYTGASADLVLGANNFSSKRVSVLKSSDGYGGFTSNYLFLQTGSSTTNVGTDGISLFSKPNQRALSINYDIAGVNYAATLDANLLNASRTFEFPNASGVLALTSNIPTNNNQLTNGAGYITSSALSPYLPLAGGTLTSSLGGTSAIFSDNITITNGARPYFIAKTTNAGEEAGIKIQQSTVSDWYIGTAQATPSASDLGIRDVKNGRVPLYFSASTGAATFSSSVTATSASFSSTVSATAITLTSDGASRALYLRGAGNIIQFQNASSVDKWEVVGREGQFYIFKNDGGGQGFRWSINSSGNHTINGSINTDSTITAGGKISTGSGGFSLNGNSGFYTSYTSDGLFSASALPNILGTVSNGGSMYLGYQDNGSGLYSPAYGFDVRSVDGIPVGGRVVKAIIMRDVNTGAQPFIVYNNGNVENANNSYGSTSDISIKENIIDATSKLDELLNIRIRNYNLKEDLSKLKQIGVIAQELETVFPSMVETDTEGLKSVKYSIFVPILIKAVQELSAKVTELENRNNN